MCADSVCRINLTDKDIAPPDQHDYDESGQMPSTFWPNYISEVSSRRNGYWTQLVMEWAKTNGLPIQWDDRTDRYDSAVVVEVTPAQILDFLDFAWGPEATKRLPLFFDNRAAAIRTFIRTKLDPNRKYGLYADVWS